MRLSRLSTVEARAMAIHDTIGMRRMLLVIDDAWHPKTALVFKVGGVNCGHLVTTRLPEVALRFSGEATVVRELNDDDSLALLTRLAPSVIEAEPNEALKLIQSVGGLPLALILMGNYLRVQAYSGQPRRLRAALKQLRQVKERLYLAESQAPAERHPSLPPGTQISLEAIIRISDEALGEISQRSIRSLSVMPPKPNTFSEAAAIAVSLVSSEVIDNLADSGLLESIGPERYTIHQTIFDYMREKSADESAYQRMAEFYVSYVETNEKNYTALEAETDNILAALQVAFDRGLLNTLVKGANAFYSFLQTRGLYEQIEIHLGRAEQAARLLRNTEALNTTLLNLGRMLHRRGDLAQTEAYFKESLTLARQTGNLENISASLQALGALRYSYGNYAEAETCFREGLGIARQTGNLERSSALLWNLGSVLENRKQYNEAENCLNEGLQITQQTGNQERISSLLRSLGKLAYDRQDYPKAEQFFQNSLNIARKIKHRWLICYILYKWGELELDQQKLEAAFDAFSETVETAREPGMREFVARGYFGLARVALGRGKLVEARRYGQESRAIFDSIGHKEAAELTHWLAELPTQELSA